MRLGRGAGRVERIAARVGQARSSRSRGVDEPERQRARTRSPRRSVTRLARRAAAKKACQIIKDSFNDLPDPTAAPLRVEKSRAGHRGLRGERARRRRARVARAAPLTASFEPVCTSSATQLRQSTPDSRPPARTTTLDSHLASSLDTRRRWRPRPSQTRRSPFTLSHLHQESSTCSLPRPAATSSPGSAPTRTSPSTASKPPSRPTQPRLAPSLPRCAPLPHSHSHSEHS